MPHLFSQRPGPKFNLSAAFRWPSCRAAKLAKIYANLLATRHRVAVSNSADNSLALALAQLAKLVKWVKNGGNGLAYSVPKVHVL